jgi:MoxR-like ATPase
MGMSDKPCNMLFRTERPDVVSVMHGDDQAKLMTFSADKETRRFMLEINAPDRVILVNAKMSVADVQYEHDAGETDIGITRNWKIEDDNFVIWNKTGSEIVLPVVDPGPLTPMNIPEVYGQDDLLFTVAMAMKLGKHSLLTGPTGTAKSTMFRWLAQTLGYNFVLSPITRDTDAAAMVGEYLPFEGVGEFGWVDGPVAQATRLSQDHPTILLFDEANRIGNVAHFSRVYSLLDDQRTLVIPEKRDENRVAEAIVAGDLFIGATANPADSEDMQIGAADYIGVQELDPALSSRFVYQPKVEYLDPLIEAKILINRVQTISPSIATLMVDAAKRVRESMEIRFPMSFRELEGWALAFPYLGYEGAAEVAVVQKAHPMFRQDLRRMLALQRGSGVNEVIA